MADKDSEKKIIIDEDWKQEAQKEKEQLAEELETEKQQEREIPQASFSGIISMLATQAFFAMGVIRISEEDEDRAPDMAMAKFNIDMLAVIEEKTKGNLETEEKKMLTDTLSQLRMAFVQLSAGEQS